MPTATFIPETPERAALFQSLHQVYALRSLSATGNALPTSPASVSQARQWLESQWQQCRLEGIRWYAPNVTTDAEGNVVFEWWAEDRTLSVYFVEAAVDGSTNRMAEYLKFGRRDGPLAGLSEQGASETAEEAAALMRWFGE